MKLSGNIRRRHYDRERLFALASSSLRVSVEIFVVQPFLVQTILNAMGIIGFCQFLAHCFLHFHFCRYRALGRREKKSEILRMKKNVPWHILAPSAVACDNLHLRASAHHWHVSAFLCNREFYRDSLLHKRHYVPIMHTRAKM